MDARDAREHLEMVDRILEQAAPVRLFRPYAPAIVIIGVAAALLVGGEQFGLEGHGYAVVWSGAILMLAGYAYLIWGGISARRNAERVTVAEARWGQTCAAVWLVVFVAAFAQPHIFSGWASAAIWSLGAAIQMLLLGFYGDRRAFWGGVVLALSMPAANWIGKPGYVLAAGFILGYVVPGLLKLFDGSDECEVRG